MLACKNAEKFHRPSTVEHLSGADNGTAMTRDYHSAANRYRPTPVRVLFIAESPPAFRSESERAYFFFEENPGADLLFTTIVEAVLGKDFLYRKRGDLPKDSVLRRFQEKGYWLMDAVEYPINNIGGKKTSDSARKRHIEQGKAKMLARVASLHAENGDTDITIVLIKNLVYECLAKPLRQAGYYVPQAGPIGFPRYHGDPKTIKGIKSAIAEHRIA
jgi:hypothetical protein